MKHLYKYLKKHRKTVAQINALEPEFEKLSEETRNQVEKESAGRR